MKSKDELIEQWRDRLLNSQKELSAKLKEQKEKNQMANSLLLVSSAIHMLSALHLWKKGPDKFSRATGALSFLVGGGELLMKMGVGSGIVDTLANAVDQSIAKKESDITKTTGSTPTEAQCVEEELTLEEELPQKQPENVSIPSEDEVLQLDEEETVLEPVDESLPLEEAVSEEETISLEETEPEETESETTENEENIVEEAHVEDTPEVQDGQPVEEVAVEQETPEVEETLETAEAIELEETTEAAEEPTEVEDADEAIEAIAMMSPVAEETTEDEEDGNDAVLLTTFSDAQLQFIDVKEKPEIYAEYLEQEKNGEVQLVTRYKSGFYARVVQSQGNVQSYYSAIKNALLKYKGVKSRISWTFDSYHCGRSNIAKINVKNKTIYLYLALDPVAMADTKYGLADVSGKKKFDEVPALLKIKGERKFKYALELIEKICSEDLQLKQLNKEEIVDYSIPYQDTDSLVESGDIKKMVAIIPLNR